MYAALARRRLRCARFGLLSARQTRRDLSKLLQQKLGQPGLEQSQLWWQGRRRQRGQLQNRFVRPYLSAARCCNESSKPAQAARRAYCCRRARPLTARTTRAGRAFTRPSLGAMWSARGSSLQRSQGWTMTTRTVAASVETADTIMRRTSTAGQRLIWRPSTGAVRYWRCWQLWL